MEPPPRADPSAEPAVTVVVATRDRRDLLERLLDGLEGQTLLPRFDVVIVDDGSTDGTTERLAARAARSAFRLRTIRFESSRGPAAARNAGAAAATADVIAFTDDDCRPEPAWLARALGTFADGVGIVQGATHADPNAADYGKPFSRTMDVRRDDGHYPTCNVFYRRRAFEDVGGFDESFRFACGEDTDLAWRVLGRGWRSAFCADAIVVHVVRAPDYGLFLKERRRFADQILVVRRHPELRRFYYRRYFYQRSHVHAAATLALIAAAAGLGRAWLLALPVVWLDRFRHTRFAGSALARVRLVAQLIVGDVWELLVFCYWSLRYRTVLL